LRERDAGQPTLRSGNRPDVRAAAETALVHGQPCLCALKYSAAFAGEQLHRVTTTLSKVPRQLRRLSRELAKPPARFAESGIRDRIADWLAAPSLAGLIHENRPDPERRMPASPMLYEKGARKSG